MKYYTLMKVSQLVKGIKEKQTHDICIKQCEMMD